MTTTRSAVATRAEEIVREIGADPADAAERAQFEADHNLIEPRRARPAECLLHDCRGRALLLFEGGRQEIAPGVDRALEQTDLDYDGVSERSAL
jgi:hypothetical protein